jgi:hypothetical protein
VALAVLFFFPLTCMAKDIWATEMKIAQTTAKIKTSLSASSEYHSNIDLKDHGTKGGMVYRVTPGVTLEIPLERLFTQFLADMSYINAEKGDTTWTGHAKGLMRYNVSDLTSIGISHDYTRGELYNVRSGNSFDLNISQVMIKHQLDPLWSVAVIGDKEKYDTHIKEGSDGYSDYDQLDGQVVLDYKMTPATTLTYSGKWARRDYKDISEKSYKSVGGEVAIAQRITPRISIGGNGGYVKRDYTGSDDVREITYGANFNAIVSPLSTLRVTYDHNIQDTFYPKDPTVLKNVFGIDDTLVNLLDENYKFVETDRVGVTLDYRMTDKDTLNIGGAYITSDSGSRLSTVSTASPDRLKEKNYYGGLGYSHKFTSWMALDIKGTYGVRNSNDRNKYDYYTASGGMSLSF